MLIECVLLSASLCHAVKDKPVLALTAAHVASVVADGITTKQFERRGRYEIQSAWIFGREPSAGRLALVWAPEVIAEMWLAERMHRSHTWVRHVWWLPQVLQIGVHGGDAIANTRLH
jgi:hypothetical protein